MLDRPERREPKGGVECFLLYEREGGPFVHSGVEESLPEGLSLGEGGKKEFLGGGGGGGFGGEGKFFCWGWGDPGTTFACISIKGRPERKNRRYRLLL